MMKILLVILAVALAGLQYKLWFSDVGVFAAERLEERLQAQARRAELLEQRNRLLTAEVIALKDGDEAIESRARRDLGMVREDETFFLIPDRNW